jgi:hypothetical protein
VAQDALLYVKGYLDYLGDDNLDVPQEQEEKNNRRIGTDIGDEL